MTHNASLFDDCIRGNFMEMNTEQENIFFAKESLAKVIGVNDLLFEKLDTNQFFISVRPYYKPCRVGANAGDVAGINVIDLLLGLCDADDEYCAQSLLDKTAFMTSDDQVALRDYVRRGDLMDEFLELQGQYISEPWFRKNLAMFLEVCEMYGETAEQYHYQLVSKFIENSAANIKEEHLVNISSSGPPLDVLLRALEQLYDLRLAVDLSDISVRFADIKSPDKCLN